MRRFGLGCLVFTGFVFHGTFAMAQSSLDALEQELNEVKQQHQDATAQNLANFFSQLDAAMGGSDAAVTLYQQAGGTLPDPTPVATDHESETATEKEARLAQDQANLAALGVMLQLHCGLMHYAALFVTSPDQKNLQQDFTAWLQKVAQAYPQLGMPPSAGGGGDQGGHKKKHDHGDAGAGAPPHPPFNLSDLKGKSMHDSIIGKFLGFKAWADKEQGGWSVKDLPKLFRADILDPSRATPTAATLAAWDTYIAMANADEPDNDKWNSSTYPPLEFDRACDDYTVTPSSEKLEGIVQIIHANLTHPQANDWIVRAKQMLDDYKAKHGGVPAVTGTTAPAPTTASPGATTNVSVITEQQGDATVITTHTNAATATPPAPK